VSVSIIRANSSGVAGVGGLSVRSRVGKVLAGVIDTPLVWHARSRDRRRLLDMDDRTLRDVGVQRAAVRQEAMKPFWRS
jgi:uncharacterized protein YjiS (DUF1127 family)